MVGMDQQGCCVADSGRMQSEEGFLRIFFVRGWLALLFTRKNTSGISLGQGAST